MIPMNLLNDNETACYINTGVWASGAIKEAKNFGKVNVLASSEEDKFRHIPKTIKFRKMRSICTLPLTTPFTEPNTTAGPNHLSL